jgi:acyl-CoA thioesterase II
MSLISLGAGANPLQFTLLVTPQLSVGHPDNLFLFGGAGMAPGCRRSKRRPAARRFGPRHNICPMRGPGQTLTLDVLVPVNGKYTTQARVVVRDGDNEILTVNAALGARPGAPEAQWAVMPDVPAPEACPVMDYNWVRRPDDLNASFHKRVAAGRFGARPGRRRPQPRWRRAAVGAATGSGGADRSHCPRGDGGFPAVGHRQRARHRGGRQQP